MNVEDFILDAIPTLPRLGSIDAQMVMKDLYETKFGIHNHLRAQVKRPLASVAFHPSENTIKNTLLEETIRTYINSAIKDVFGLDLIEFLELPMDIVGLLLEIANETSVKKGNEIDSVKRDLDKLTK